MLFAILAALYKCRDGLDMSSSPPKIGEDRLGPQICIAPVDLDFDRLEAFRLLAVVRLLQFLETLTTSDVFSELP